MIKRRESIPENLYEALELLNEAAQSKRDELTQVLETQYEDLMEVINGFSESIKNKTTKVKHQVKHAMDTGQKKVEETALQVDEDVHRRPWFYLGGIALGALLLGVSLSHKKKKTAADLEVE